MENNEEQSEVAWPRNGLSKDAATIVREYLREQYFEGKEHVTRLDTDAGVRNTYSLPTFSETADSVTVHAYDTDGIIEGVRISIHLNMRPTIDADDSDTGEIVDTVTITNILTEKERAEVLEILRAAESNEEPNYVRQGIRETAIVTVFCIATFVVGSVAKHFYGRTTDSAASTSPQSGSEPSLPPAQRQEDLPETP